MTSQAEHPPALQPFFCKNAFCAETLSCPATGLAVENSRFMPSQHDSSFNSVYWPRPGLHLRQSLVQKQRTRKVLLRVLLHHKESFSRLYSKLDSTEKHDSNFGNIRVKECGSFQKRGFQFFFDR